MVSEASLGASEGWRTALPYSAWRANLHRRPAKFKEQITPAAVPIIIDLVFVDVATKQETPGYPVTIPLSGYPRDLRYTRGFGDRGQ